MTFKKLLETHTASNDHVITREKLSERVNNVKNWYKKKKNQQ